MSYNTDLMIEVKNYLEEHPEEHDQDSWGRRTACGTTGCIAGTAAILNGADIFWRDADGLGNAEAMYRCDSWTPFEYAVRALGLNNYEANWLFHTRTNAEAMALLDRFIAAGKNGDGVEWDDGDE